MRPDPMPLGLGMLTHLPYPYKQGQQICLSKWRGEMQRLRAAIPGLLGIMPPGRGKLTRYNRRLPRSLQPRRRLARALREGFAEAGGHLSGHADNRIGLNIRARVGQIVRAHGPQ